MPKKEPKTKTKKRTKAAEKKKAKPKKKTAKATKKEVKKVKKATKPKKKAVKKKVEKKRTLEKEEKEKPVKFYEATGKRKTAVARVRIWTKGEKEFLINQKPLAEYFPTPELQKVALASLERMKCVNKFKLSVRAKGGGISGQAEAVRHGIAKALVLFNPDFRKRLKKAGFLRRDARMRERKKFGLKRARRAPQWKKR